MKKLLFLLAVLCVTYSLQAQDGELRYGAKAGLNICKITGIGGQGLLWRPHFGAFAEYSINEKFKIQPEAVFSWQGSYDYNWDYAPGNQDGKFKYVYLNLPIMAKYYVIDNLALLAGLQIGINLSARYKYVESKHVDNINYQTKLMELGIAFGASYNINEQFDVAFRYNYGLTDHSTHIDRDNTAFHNSVVQFSLGYYLK